MKSRRKNVALVFPPIPSYSRKLTQGIVERHLAHRDWAIVEVPRLVRGESPFDPSAMRPDGAIVWAEAGDVWVRDLLDERIPVVNCGMEWIGVNGVASVHFDYDDIQLRLLDHFTSLGFTRLVAIGHNLAKRPVTRQVLESFVSRANDAGLDSQLWELDGEDSPSVMPRRLLATAQETSLAEFLKSLRKPTAIFCLGDHIGYIVAAVASRMGIKVPDKLAIAGYGDNMVAGFADPPLTTIDGASHAVGRTAADCLDHWMQNGQPPFLDLAIPGTELIERESTVGKSGSVTMEAVRRYVETHAKRGISLNELVSLSGLSVKTLVRQYRDSYGHDPAEHIQAHRLQEVKQLLDKPTLTISAVAIASGFSSQNAFANYFQRHVGCSPGAYRREKETSE